MYMYIHHSYDHEWILYINYIIQKDLNLCVYFTKSNFTKFIILFV